MKIAAVTGAGSGIGRALALELSSRGYRVAASDVSEDGLRATADLVGAAGGTIDVARVDVTKPQEIYDWAERIREDLGDVSVAINNAGVSVTGTFESTPQADMEWLFAVNWWGVVHGTRAFLPQLHASAKAGGGAHLVNISSIFGIIGVPSQTAYCAAKAAVRGFTESLRGELHDSGITIHTVHPGGVATRIAEDAKYSSNTGPVDSQRAKRLIAKGMQPADAARIIVRGMEAGRERILVGSDAAMLDRLQRWFPAAYTGIIRRGARWV